jgi:hypothetical protein
LLQLIFFRCIFQNIPDSPDRVGLTILFHKEGGIRKLILCKAYFLTLFNKRGILFLNFNKRGASLRTT